MATRLWHNYCEKLLNNRYTLSMCAVVCYTGIEVVMWGILRDLWPVWMEKSAHVRLLNTKRDLNGVPSEGRREVKITL